MSQTTLEISQLSEFFNTFSDRLRDPQYLSNQMITALNRTSKHFDENLIQSMLENLRNTVINIAECPPYVIQYNKTIQNCTDTSKKCDQTAAHQPIAKEHEKRHRPINIDRLLVLVSILIALLTWMCDKVSSVAADRRQAEMHQEIIELLDDIRDGSQHFYYSSDGIHNAGNIISESN